MSESNSTPAPALDETERANYTANITKYSIYAALNGLGYGLFIAIWIIYLQEGRNLSLTEIGIMEAFFWLVMAGSEVPTGAVADNQGRKTSMLWGTALISVSMLLWGLADTLPLLTVTYLVMGVGFTFLSGAQDAFLFESLHLLGRQNDYTRMSGRVSAITLVGAAVGSAASGFLASVDLALPIFIAALTFVLALLVALSFTEPAKNVTALQSGQNRYYMIVRESLRLMRTRPTLRHALIYVTFIAAGVFFLRAYFLQPQAVALNVPVAIIGIIVTVVTLADIAGSAWAYRIGEHFGDRRVLYSAPFILIACMLILAVYQALPVLVLFAVTGFLAAVLRPLVMNAIHHEVSDEVRATILSMQALMYTLVMAVSVPALGLIADNLGLPSVYLAIALGLAVYTLFLFWRSRASFPRPRMQTAEAQLTE